MAFWNTFLRQGSHQSADVSVWFVILVCSLYNYGSKSEFAHSLSVFHIKKKKKKREKKGFLMDYEYLNDCCLTPSE